MDENAARHEPLATELEDACRQVIDPIVIFVFFVDFVISVIQ